MAEERGIRRLTSSDGFSSGSSRCNDPDWLLARRIIRASCTRRALVASALLGLVTVRPSCVAAGSPAARAVATSETGYSWWDAASWIFDQQLPDGGFPGPAGDSDPETTADAVMAGYAGGSSFPASRVQKSAREYLLTYGPDYAARGPGQAARLALAAIALFENPTAFGGDGPPTAISDPPCVEFERSGGVDLFHFMEALFVTPASESLPGLAGYSVTDHALALIVFNADPMQVDSQPAADLLERTQAESGGWSVDGSPDPNSADTRTTALVIQALQDNVVGIDSVVRRGLAYLRSTRVADGGFAINHLEPRVADAISTAMVMQALTATSEDPSTREWGDVPRALARYQLPAGGFRLLMSDSEPNLPATLQAVIALSGRYLPVRYFCE